jgi:AcrR family transcriptional regulator
VSVYSYRKEWIKLEKSLVHRRESIIVSTIEVLNRVGLQNLSTKLIARQEGVSEGTLFRHFESKTQILAAVIDQFGQFDNAIIETCAQKKLSPVASLRYFFSAYAEYYENYPEITVVMQLYDSLLNEAGLADKIRTIIHKREDSNVLTTDAVHEIFRIMHTLKSSSHKMHRIVRDISKKMGKEINLNIIGEETEVDNNIIDQIGDQHRSYWRFDSGGKPGGQRLNLYPENSPDPGNHRRDECPGWQFQVYAAHYPGKGIFYPAKRRNFHQSQSSGNDYDPRGMLSDFKTA